MDTITVAFWNEDPIRLFPRTSEIAKGQDPWDAFKEELEWDPEEWSDKEPYEWGYRYCIISPDEEDKLKKLQENLPEPRTNGELEGIWEILVPAFKAAAAKEIKAMRMICICSVENERPFHGVAYVDDHQGPDEALDRWVNSRWREDIEKGLITKEIIQDMSLEYFFVDPIVGFLAHAVEDNAGSDGEGDVANNIRYRLCRMAEVSEDYAIPAPQYRNVLENFFKGVILPQEEANG